mmetsp:Transcript_13468/g.35723  ORF Transcript_13468/g.35723 Transcript_13468/m.35723 type:complete len:90 (-) Transcript_13468:4-273(-)
MIQISVDDAVFGMRLYMTSVCTHLCVMLLLGLLLHDDDALDTSWQSDTTANRARRRAQLLAGMGAMIQSNYKRHKQQKTAAVTDPWSSL